MQNMTESNWFADSSALIAVETSKMEASNSHVATRGVAPVATTGVLSVGTEEMGLTETHLVLSQMNLHIWHNETQYRAGTGDGNLGLTHGLNGIRNTAKNMIQENSGGRKDYKIDCIAAEFKDWEISWNG